MKHVLYSVQSMSLRKAFTLVEMLVVMAVILILIGLAVPVVNGIKGGSDFTTAVSGIAGTLGQARSYAMANNTYVFVGIGEFKAGEASSVSPRTAGVGQIAVVAVATRDGTRGYDLTQPQSTWQTNYQNAGNGSTLLTALDRLHVYDNVHLADFGDKPPDKGNMSRPAAQPEYRLGNVKCSSVTPISWALGKTSSQAQYNITNVIQYDPQGIARIQLASNSDNIPSVMEIGLQPSRGAVIPTLPSDPNTGNQAALSIDSMTGVVRIYRP